MKRVFLSHSSADAAAVRQLAEDLKRSGLEIWLDEAEIKVGDAISRSIERGLDSTDVLVLWLSRHAVQSGWVDTEWRSRFHDEIASGQVVVLPLLADDCEIPRLLRDKKYADFRTSYRDGLSQLLKVIGVQTAVNSIGMEFRLIPPGAFLMGSDRGEENERPAHQVTINRPFYMAVDVVTQEQWRSVMRTSPWGGHERVRDGNRFPAVNVTWFDAQQFLTKLGELDSRGYYLPTEEEWEYAARAGTTTEFSFGDDERDLRSFGWYSDMTQGREEYAHEVGTKRPNPWGLRDMHGNIWEWTDSWYYGSYAAQPKLNPMEKVVRGGAWDYPAKGARSAFRNTVLPSRPNHVIGFRVIRGA